MTLATLSMDLDNHWSYLKTRGDPRWHDLPSYLDVVVPRALEFFGRRDLQVTFFVVGEDADRPEHHDVLHSIVEAGHEVGNHSYRHEPWLHRYSSVELDHELTKAEAAILRATGRKPLGFRGPGYSLSPATLDVLVRRGYQYDASTLPSIVGPLARAYYFRRARLTEAERDQRASLFGGAKDGLRPLRPYRWNTGDGSLIELPVTTMPLFRIPMHVSYVLYMAGTSRSLALRYLRTGLVLCRLRGIPPSILLHPLDFLGPDEAPGLEFFPGMTTPLATKQDVVSAAVDMLQRSHDVVPLSAQADALATLPLPELDATRCGSTREIRAPVRDPVAGGV